MKCQSFPCFATVFALTLAWGLTSLHAADETLLDAATIVLMKWLYFVGLILAGRSLAFSLDSSRAGRTSNGDDPVGGAVGSLQEGPAQSQVSNPRSGYIDPTIVPQTDRPSASIDK
jgi:hypothetical protein